MGQFHLLEVYLRINNCGFYEYLAFDCAVSELHVHISFQHCPEEIQESRD